MVALCKVTRLCSVCKVGSFACILIFTIILQDHMFALEGSTQFKVRGHVLACQETGLPNGAFHPLRGSVKRIYFDKVTLLGMAGELWPFAPGTARQLCSLDSRSKL